MAGYFSLVCKTYVTHPCERNYGALSTDKNTNKNALDPKQSGIGLPIPLNIDPKRIQMIAQDVKPGLDRC